MLELCEQKRGGALAQYYRKVANPDLAAKPEVFDKFWTHAGKPDVLTQPIAPPPPQPPSG